MKKIKHLVDILTEKCANSLQHTPVLTYIAGYCYYSVCKKLQCETCKTKITSQVGNLRSIKNAIIFRIISGGFLYPLSDVVYIATDNYIIVNKLGKIDEFKLAPSQRQFVVHTTMSALDEEDFFL